MNASSNLSRLREEWQVLNESHVAQHGLPADALRARVKPDVIQTARGLVGCRSVRAVMDEGLVALAVGEVGGCEI
jgi:hypothetical protein